MTISDHVTDTAEGVVGSGVASAHMDFEFRLTEAPEVLAGNVPGGVRFKPARASWGTSWFGHGWELYRTCYLTSDPDGYHLQASFCGSGITAVPSWVPRPPAGWDAAVVEASRADR